MKNVTALVKKLHIVAVLKYANGVARTLRGCFLAFAR